MFGRNASCGRKAPWLENTSRRDHHEGRTLAIDKEIRAPDCTFINAAAPLNCPGGSREGERGRWIINVNRDVFLLKPSWVASSQRPINPATLPGKEKRVWLGLFSQYAPITTLVKPGERWGGGGVRRATRQPIISISQCVHVALQRYHIMF